MIGIGSSQNIADSTAGKYERIIFLDDDAVRLERLRKSVPAGVTVEDLAGRFDPLYEKLHAPLVRALMEAASGVPPDIWWSGQLASRSSTATNVMRNVIYAHAAAEIVNDDPGQNILLLCADMGLLRCLIGLCRDRGFAHRCHVSAARRLALAARAAARPMVNLLFIVRDVATMRRLRHVLPPPASLREDRRRAVIRTWVTAGTIDDRGRYQDRHFGALPEYLRRKGLDVLVIPMFFNIARSLREQLALMARSDQEFLIPHHHVGFGSLLRMLWHELRRRFIRFGKVPVEGIDVAPILRHQNRKDAFEPAMFRLNLVNPLLRRLRRRGVDIELFLYPFENNAPEKQFLAARQRWYPDSTIIACQHSVWLSRQAGAELVPEEVSSHPLADRIVVCGRVYMEVLAGLGFPKDRLRLGPSLRFAQVRDYEFVPRDRKADRPPEIFLALPFCRNTSLDMLARLRRAIGDDFRCTVLLKTHPLLPAVELRSRLDVLAFQSLEIVEGSPVEWFRQCDVAVAAGTSVTQMEAIACGVPLVRVVPSNTFFLDPMRWTDYPLEPAATAAQLRERIEVALQMTDEQLRLWSETIKRDYFEPATDETMAVYLES